MTSQRAYAVAALALSACLPLGACTQADSADGEAKPKASATAYPLPVYEVTHEQAKAVVTVGQRLVDGINSAPIRAEAIKIGFCDDGYNSAAGRTWYATGDVPEQTQDMPMGYGGTAATQIGFTFTGVVVLDDSYSAAHSLDEQIREWSACQPSEGDRLATQKVAVPGAAKSLVRTLASKDSPAWKAHQALAVARVENVLIACTTDARTAKLALSTTMPCLTEMTDAVPFAAKQGVEVSDTNRVVATKMLLARAALKGQTASLRTKGLASRPCETSRKTFLPAGTVEATIETEVPLVVADPNTAKAPDFLGSISAERASDPAAARAKVAAARKTFGECKGTYSQGTAPHVTTGKIISVADEALGQGGFTITRTSQYPGQKKPQTIRTSIFSVGTYVVELFGATPKNAAAIATRLKVVAGS